MRNKQYLLIVFLISLIVVLKTDMLQNVDTQFLSIDKCPCCYGVDCNQTLSGQLKLVSFSRSKVFNYLFNVKNVFYGQLDSSFVVLKKLAHSSELIQLDRNFCEAAKFPSTCNVGEAVKTLVEKSDHKLSAIVETNKSLFKKCEAIKCGHQRVLNLLFENYRASRSPQHIVEHFITLLATNPEPLIIEAFQGIFPMPKFYEACGRMVIEEFVGRSLTSYYKSPWSYRAKLALQLLKMADAMSNHEIRMYLTDPSCDNFAVDRNGVLRLIDLENIVLVDSREPGLEESIHYNEGIGCNDCLSYEYEELCRHFKADHNYFAICKGLLSSNPFSSSIPGGLLHSIPDQVLEKVPNLPSIIEECASPSVSGNRINPAASLANVLSQLT